MYDIFPLTDQTDILKASRTSHYYLTNDASLIDPCFTVAEHDRLRSFIFTTENGTDAFYLLSKHHPDLGLPAKLIQTSIKKENCYDIVFLSNGEPNADAHYARLEALEAPNRLHWVKDIKGRNNAYREAARVSQTPYFFAVFAKIEIDLEFDFTFGALPFDTRHYVFYSHNPVNNLEYGHQGIILYHKEQVLRNPGTSLDFTMAQLYREIPVVSGIARYNTSALATWRTAFRECLKLCVSQDTVSKERLEKWLTGEGAFAKDSIKGAQDAIFFYEKNKDNSQALQHSYDWDWLDDYFLLCQKSQNTYQNKKEVRTEEKREVQRKPTVIQHLKTNLDFNPVTLRSIGRKIQVVHLELSSHCNLRCPQCARTHGDDPNPNLVESHLTLEKIKSLLPSDLIPELTKVYSSGNYGEPTLNPECLEIYQYLRKYNSNMTLGLHTNGVTNNPDWWRELARILGENHYVLFAFDGLEDTYSITRRDGSFSALVENMKAFISARGKVSTETLLYQHNAHQEDEIRSFLKDVGVINSVFRDPISYIPPSVSSWLKLREQPGSVKSDSKRKIVCQALEEESLYIGSDGRIYPCPYVGYLPYAMENERFKALEKTSHEINNTVYRKDLRVCRINCQR